MPFIREPVAWQEICTICGKPSILPGDWTEAEFIGKQVEHDAFEHSGWNDEGEDG